MNHLFTRPPKKDSAHMAGQGARHGTVLKGPVSVVIPCYRSAAYLEETVDELFDVFFMHPDLRMHLFLINDGSPDGTFEVIRELCRKYKGQVTGINLSHNVGQAQAKMAAFGLIHEGITIFMDDDGQHDPFWIFPLLQKIQNGYHIVYARFPEMKESPFRRLGSRMIDLLLLLFTGKPPGLKITSFFALDEAALAELKTYHSRHPFIGGHLLRKRYRAANVKVPQRSRTTGHSGYSLQKLLKRTMEMTILYRIQLKKTDPPLYTIQETVFYSK